MGQTQDFPFDIEDISELLRLRNPQALYRTVFIPTAVLRGQSGQNESSAHVKMSGAAIIAVRAAVC